MGFIREKENENLIVKVRLLMERKKIFEVENKFVTLKISDKTTLYLYTKQIIRFNLKLINLSVLL